MLEIYRYEKPAWLDGKFVVTEPVAVMWRDTLFAVWPPFTTELRSVPKLARGFFTNDRVLLAAILHDSIYRNVRCAGHRPCRRKADRMLREISIAQGLPRLKAWVAWLAVRLFSGARYQKPWLHW